MDNFENIKSQWGEKNIPEYPEGGHIQVVKKAGEIRKKQTISQVVLSITVIILAGFFLYISAYKNMQVSVGLSLMMGSLIIRILLEFFSKSRLRKLSVILEVSRYKEHLQHYYQTRKWTHFLITPCLFILYIIGFILLLPGFKQSLSPGFYTYILISSVFIFVFFAVFISVQIRNELQHLKKLQMDD